MIENKCAHLLKQHEYREDSINYMFGMQYDLQKFVSDKRKNLSPDTKNVKRSCHEALYYWGCLTAEYAELQERDWSNNPTAELLLETQFEYIDMYHFLMNFFIFTKQHEFDFTLEDLYNETPDTFCEPNLQVEKQWSTLSVLAGEYMDILPYKHWKTYKLPKLETEELLAKAKQILYSFILMGKALGITKEHFFNLYISKNQENINRQKNNY